MTFFQEPPPDSPQIGIMEEPETAENPKPRQRWLGHHKHGSDCTIIDGMQHDLECIIEERKEEDPNKLVPRLNPISNLVTFIRTNSIRIKKSLQKESDHDKPKDPEISAEDSINKPPAIILIPSGFEEICRPAHGLLRRSESGPITFHRAEQKQDKFSSRRSLGLNRTYPRRSKPSSVSVDSGFESSSSLPLKIGGKKKKKVLAYYSTSMRQNLNNFNFKESSTQDASYSIEAMLPALIDVSDDDLEERPELFFGEFPGKPLFPLKTEKDIKSGGTSSRHFSRFYCPGFSRSSSSGSTVSQEDLKRLFAAKADPASSDSNSDMELIISPCPGDCDSLQHILSDGIESVEMFCDSNLEGKFLTGRLVVWTPDLKQKVKKVYLSQQKPGTLTPENTIKLTNENGEWKICPPGKVTDSRKTTILLSIETDTERSESISTTATSPIFEDGYNEDFDTDEELYFNMREQMKTLDQDIDCTPNQDDLPCSVINYMNKENM